MGRRNGSRTLLSALLLSWAAGAQEPPSSAKGWHAAQAPAPVIPGDPMEIVFWVPAGEGGVHYFAEGRPEMTPSGPAALAVGTDGTFWIGDTVASRIVHLGPHGEFLGTIDLQEAVVGIADLEATDRELVVLDLAAIVPKVVRVALGGGILGSVDIPADLVPGLSGIALGASGEIWVERERGAAVARLVEPDRVIGDVRTTGEIPYEVQPADIAGATAGRGRFRTRSIAVEVRVDHLLGGLWMIGWDRSGGFFLAVEEVATNGTIDVDQTVRHYDASGMRAGQARVPIAAFHTYVHNGLAVGPDGHVYALVTRPGGVAVCRLRFVPELEPLLPRSSAHESESGNLPSPGTGTACRSRLEMWSTALSFFANTVWLSAANIDGRCSGRGKPRYLRGVGLYPSVSYDWGGWDAPALFNAFMSPGTSQAGDINTTVESCSKGTDCSGLISRAWGLPTKQSTRTLPSYSNLLSSTTLVTYGDILNRAGQHVVLFDRASNGVYAFESTTDQNYDRVAYTFFSWSRYSSYQARRYREVCP